MIEFPPSNQKIQHSGVIIKNKNFSGTWFKLQKLYNLELTFDIRKFINFLYCLFLMKPSHHPPRSHSNIKCKKQRLFFCETNRNLL